MFRLNKKHLMLAPCDAIDYGEIEFPVLASYKLDGIRCFSGDGEMFTRSWKPFSTAVQKRFWKTLKLCREKNVILDGEIFSPEIPFNELMTELAPKNEKISKDIKYYVFDSMYSSEWNLECLRTFEERTKALSNFISNNTIFLGEEVQVLTQRPLFKIDQLKDFFDEAIEKGHEGLILRTPESEYKHGRVTAKEKSMWKMKKNATVDCKLVGFVQATRMKQEYKEGEAREHDDLGYLKRSHKKDNREPIDEIGSFEVQLKDGTVCKATLAKDVDLRVTWDNREKFVGKWVEIEFMPHGVKDKPRFPRITRWRPDLD